MLDRDCRRILLDGMRPQDDNFSVIISISAVRLIEGRREEERRRRGKEEKSVVNYLVHFQRVGVPRRIQWMDEM